MRHRKQYRRFYGDFRTMERTLQNNGWYGNSSGEYGGLFYYGIMDSADGNYFMEYWADILDRELGDDWWRDYAMTFGSNPDPSTNYVYRDAIIIEPH